MAETAASLRIKVLLEAIRTIRAIAQRPYSNAYLDLDEIEDITERALNYDPPVN